MAPTRLSVVELLLWIAAAIGVAVLPMDAAVEVEGLFEVG